MPLYEFLIIMHVVGTVLGGGAATFAEIYYTRFGSDDIITDDESKPLTVTYTVMRTGLFLPVVLPPDGACGRSHQPVILGEIDHRRSSCRECAPPAGTRSATLDRRRSVAHVMVC